MSKLKIGVLRGGPSSEYEVSIQTGDQILTYLKGHDNYEPIDILIDKNGDWHIGGLTIHPHSLHEHVDMAFNALHGEYGEDGTIQDILEEVPMPYTGSRAHGSHAAMNKMVAKELFREAGIKTAAAVQVPHFCPDYRQDNPFICLEKKAEDVFRKIAPPWIIKPITGGSSVGVRTARTVPELINALHEAYKQNVDVMVEQLISGREATCGVLENFRGEDVYVLPPTEIIPPPQKDLFDYECKYDGSTQEICPGKFSKKVKDTIQGIARDAHKILDLRHYSRSDFIVTPREEIYLLETNTLPGLTSESLFPKSLAAVGSSFDELIDHLIQLALRKK